MNSEAVSSLFATPVFPPMRSSMTLDNMSNLSNTLEYQNFFHDEFSSQRSSGMSRWWVRKTALILRVLKSIKKKLVSTIFFAFLARCFFHSYTYFLFSGNPMLKIWISTSMHLTNNHLRQRTIFSMIYCKFDTYFFCFILVLRTHLRHNVLLIHFI
jgi:hypothetical protein